MSEQPVQDFDKLWDYSNPGATEQKFRALLPGAEARGAEYRGQLGTQIARALGLQRKFREAHQLLDEVEAQLEGKDVPVARVRLLLDRGRTCNSGGERERAVPLFEQAWERARAIGEHNLAVDAAHMMGIVTSGAESIAWHERAMEYAESCGSQRAQGWLGPLYNNLGWTYHDLGEFQRALELFEKGLTWRRTRGAERPIQIARYTVGRALRSLGRLEEALPLQEQLRADIDAAAGPPDGYVFEELGECLLAIGRVDESRPMFARAHALLAQDAWLAEHEAARLDRLLQLACQSQAGD